MHALNLEAEFRHAVLGYEGSPTGGTVPYRVWQTDPYSQNCCLVIPPYHGETVHIGASNMAEMVLCKDASVYAELIINGK